MLRRKPRYTILHNCFAQAARIVSGNGDVLSSFRSRLSRKPLVVFEEIVNSTANVILVHTPRPRHSGRGDWAQKVAKLLRGLGSEYKIKDYTHNDDATAPPRGSTRTLLVGCLLSDVPHGIASDAFFWMTP